MTFYTEKNVCSILCKIEFWPFFSLVWVRNTCGCPGVSRGTCPKRLKLTFLFRHLRHLTGKSHFSVGQWPFQLPFFETQDALDGTCEDTQIPYFMFFHCCSWHNTHVKTRENEEGKSFFRKIISLLLELVSSFLSLSLFCDMIEMEDLTPADAFTHSSKAFQKSPRIIVVMSSTCANNIISRRCAFQR